MQYATRVHDEKFNLKILLQAPYTTQHKLREYKHSLK